MQVRKFDRVSVMWFWLTTNSLVLIAFSSGTVKQHEVLSFFSPLKDKNHFYTLQILMKEKNQLLRGLYHENGWVDIRREPMKHWAAPRGSHETLQYKEGPTKHWAAQRWPHEILGSTKRAPWNTGQHKEGPMKH